MPTVEAVSWKDFPIIALVKAVLPALPSPTILNLLRFHGLLPCCSARWTCKDISSALSVLVVVVGTSVLIGAGAEVGAVIGAVVMGGVVEAAMLSFFSSTFSFFAATSAVPVVAVVPALLLEVLAPPVLLVLPLLLLMV